MQVTMSQDLPASSPSRVSLSWDWIIYRPQWRATIHPAWRLYTRSCSYHRCVCMSVCMCVCMCVCMRVCVANRSIYHATATFLHGLLPLWPLLSSFITQRVLLEGRLLKCFPPPAAPSQAWSGGDRSGPLKRQLSQHPSAGEVSFSQCPELFSIRHGPCHRERFLEMVSQHIIGWGTCYITGLKYITCSFFTHHPCRYSSQVQRSYY